MTMDDELMEAMDAFATHAQAALRASAAGKAHDAAIEQHYAQAACDRAVDLVEAIMEKEGLKTDGQ